MKINTSTDSCSASCISLIVVHVDCIWLGCICVFLLLLRNHEIIIYFKRGAGWLTGTWATFGLHSNFIDASIRQQEIAFYNKPPSGYSVNWNQINTIFIILLRIPPPLIYLYISDNINKIWKVKGGLLLSWISREQTSSVVLLFYLRLQAHLPVLPGFPSYSCVCLFVYSKHECSGLTECLICIHYIVQVYV